MPVYQVKPKGAHSSEHMRIVQADTPSQVARYLAKGFEITSLTTDELVPLFESGVKIENGRPNANAPAEDGPEDSAASYQYVHKPACPARLAENAGAAIPIGEPPCLCNKLDRVTDL
jgi:hypothetical protein